jgi:hypothetical protein
MYNSFPSIFGAFLCTPPDGEKAFIIKYLEFLYGRTGSVEVGSSIPPGSTNSITKSSITKSKAFAQQWARSFSCPQSEYRMVRVIIVNNFNVCSGCVDSAVDLLRTLFREA